MKPMLVSVGILTALLLSVNLPAQQSKAASSPTGVATKNRKQPLDVTYIGNEGFMIQAGGKKVLVDALFYNKLFPAPSQELLAQMTGGSGPFADVDLLLVTHPHGDHFNPKLVAEFLRNHARCLLVAHTQTVDELRKEEGFAQIENQVHEVRLEPGLRENMTINGIALDVLSLDHMPYYQNGRFLPEHLPGRMDVRMRNLAFIVNLGGTRFLHMGDASVENSLEHLNAYPFDGTPVDTLFLNRSDQSQETQQFIAERIKPSRIVAMHIPPGELAEETNRILGVYPHAIVFKDSMERRSIPIEVDFHNLSGDYLGQPLPGAIPEVFALGIVSTDGGRYATDRPQRNAILLGLCRPDEEQSWHLPGGTHQRRIREPDANADRVHPDDGPAPCDVCRPRGILGGAGGRIPASLRRIEA